MIKDIPETFVKNCDGVGDNKFIRLKKEGNVYMYRRERMDGTVKSYEVFIAKFIAKGTPLPGGAVEKEDRMQYPGANQFGKTASDCKTEAQAEELFEHYLVKAKNREEAAAEAKLTGKRNRGRRQAKAKPVVNIPKDKFTMRMLISDTGFSQPQLYPVVKNWIQEGLIEAVDTIRAEGGRGRPSLVYKMK